MQVLPHCSILLVAMMPRSPSDLGVKRALILIRNLSFSSYICILLDSFVFFLGCDFEPLEEGHPDLLRAFGVDFGMKHFP